MTEIFTNQKLEELITQESTTKYFIEYEIFKSNHMAHGIVALHRLGASEARIKRFIDWYGNHMEPPSYSNHTGEKLDAEPANDIEMDRLLGKRKRYYDIRNRYQIKLQEADSLESYVQSEFPRLSRGISCSALHGLIQIGYGFCAHSSVAVSEGMAYLHHSYNPLVFGTTDAADSNIIHFGKGTSDILEVLGEIGTDDVLRNRMLEGAECLAKSGWESSRFQYRMSWLMQAGNDLLKYVNKINIPVISENLNPDPVTLTDWLLNQAIAVYTMSERTNDFFLLHGVTGAWALKQLIPVLKHTDAMDAIRTLTCVLLAAYIVQDSPALLPEKITSCQNYDDSTWRKLIGETLSRDRDEHVYKLVQVCHDMWEEHKTSDNRNLYVVAAKSCLNNELYFLSK